VYKIIFVGNRGATATDLCGNIRQIPELLFASVCRLYSLGCCGCRRRGRGQDASAEVAAVHGALLQQLLACFHVIVHALGSSISQPHDEDDDDIPSTIGVEFHTLTVTGDDGSRIKAHIWDTGALLRLAIFPRKLLISSHACIFVATTQRGKSGTTLSSNRTCGAKL